MTAHISLSLATLSVVVAILASYAALNLAQTVTQSKGRAQLIWLTCGALAMGSGIWSMHFIGMLAYEMPGMVMAYDIPEMTLSVVVAIGASALALYIISREIVSAGSIIAAGIAMAAAIAGMHYIGMLSMRMAATITWNSYLVLASVAVALVASLGALTIMTRFRNRPARFFEMLAASIVMGVAISGMHYTGMAAATFTHADELRFDSSHLMVSENLEIAVVLTALIVLALALIASIVQRVWTSRSQRVDARERQLRTITNAAPILLGQVDTNERLLFANEALCRWLQRPLDQVIGSRFRDLLGAEAYPHNEPYIRRALAGEIVKYERVSHSGNLTATLNITFVPEFSGDGRVSSFVLVASDVSKYKEIEAELKKAKQSAEDANATKSAFLANMSHEIRTPLGAVLGFSELLYTNEMTPAERTDCIEVIKRNGHLLSTVINDILDLSKVEAGKLEIERTDVSLVEVLNEIGSVLSLTAAERGLTLSVTAEGPVPSRISTDSLRLRQILLNVVGNALKFTKRGSVAVRVKLEPAEHGASKLAFIVTDTGEGIAPEQVPRLFAPFTQADVSTTRRFGGTGLGLVLSRRLARALGGDVALLGSTPGIGSTFVVTIDPGTFEQVLFTSHTATDSDMLIQTKPKRRDLTNLNILVVDDAPDNQLLVSKILRRAGATVETANNGREAVEKAISGSFQVILMDLQMPEMDGYEATRTLRSRGYTKPIIALTAHAMKEERQHALQNGFDGHVTKPIDHELLLRALARFAP